jgi:phosphatidylglycerophosphatase A
MQTAKLVATCFGIGYIRKGGGTVAAMVFCLFWLLIAPQPYLWGIIAAFIFMVAGIWSSNIVEAKWGKDSNRVVIDEVLGMQVSLLWVPVDWRYVLIGFLLFRFFDIVKPLYIRRAEKLPAGWGVMTDDLLAGIYSNILIQLIIITGLIK